MASGIEDCPDAIERVLPYKFQVGTSEPLMKDS